MGKVSDEIYKKINNGIYDSDEIDWWGKDSSFNLIESVLNPVRVNYFKKIIKKINLNTSGKNALEVGCGGGILSEEICRMGFITAGIDPSEQSVSCAKEHSAREGLGIEYIKGCGEALPFKNESFHAVFCCDVLEHVRDLPKVIVEISRVLKPGGMFFYDTINRTWVSKLVVIKVLQDWRRWAIMPPNLHIWKMLIRPDELKELLHQNNLEWKEHKGIKLNRAPLEALHYLHKRVKNKISNEEFSKIMRFIEGNHLRVIYMGYAVKIPEKNNLINNDC